MTKTQATLPFSLYPRGDTDVSAVQPTGQREIIIRRDIFYRREKTLMELIVMKGQEANIPNKQKHQIQLPRS